jgi:hypothetical protein
MKIRFFGGVSPRRSGDDPLMVRSCIGLDSLTSQLVRCLFALGSVSVRSLCSFGSLVDRSRAIGLIFGAQKCR